MSLYGLFARQVRPVREGLRECSGGCHGEEFVLALLTSQRDMLKIKRIFNTLRGYVAVFNISARFDLHSIGS
jgi:hypothetical protein